MPVRNMWSLHPGEVLTAEKVKAQLPDVDVYFPLRDVGIDLLLVRGNLHCSVQVKESRYHQTGQWLNSWHQVTERALSPLASSRRKAADFFVFLTYYPNVGTTGVPKFTERYIIVPISDLISLASKKRASNGVYSFCFSFDDPKVIEYREEPPVDYTSFLENWGLIRAAL